MILIDIPPAVIHCSLVAQSTQQIDSASVSAGINHLYFENLPEKLEHTERCKLCDRRPSLSKTAQFCDLTKGTLHHKKVAHAIMRRFPPHTAELPEEKKKFCSVVMFLFVCLPVSQRFACVYHWLLLHTRSCVNNAEG